MSFIGNVPAEAYSPVVKDTFSGNGSTTDFTLSIPATTNSVNVYVENVAQEPTDAYTISGTTLSFTAAPVSGTDNIYVIHRGPAVQQVVPPAGVAIDASSVTASGNLSVTGTTTLTDDLAVDTNTLVVDTTNNRVGIGTASPSNPLHITNNSSTVSTAYFNNTSAGGDSPALIVQGGANNAGAVGVLEVRDYNGNTDFYVGGTGNLAFNSGFGSVATAYGCRAWVNFDGTGTVAIRNSGNVSSITDDGTGKYTVNFTTAMPDANYSVSVDTIAQSDAATFRAGSNFSSNTASSAEIRIGQSASYIDKSYVSAAIHR